MTYEYNQILYLKRLQVNINRVNVPVIGHLVNDAHWNILSGTI